MVQLGIPSNETPLSHWSQEQSYNIHGVRVVTMEPDATWEEERALI